MEKRRELSESILEEFRKWLIGIHPVSKWAMGRAATYALEQWPCLTNYLLDGRLEISNNRAERSIKPFVMGQKNLFLPMTLTKKHLQMMTMLFLGALVRNTKAKEKMGNKLNEGMIVSYKKVI